VQDQTVADIVFGKLLSGGQTCIAHRLRERTTRPLALYYFGDNDADRRRVLDRTTSGNVTINGTIMHVGQDDLPFGGVGARRDGQVPRDRGLPDAQPPQGHLRAGSRWNSTRLLRAPSASVPMLSSTSSFDDLAGGHRRRRRVPP
jgi:hypothetical protein